MLKGIVSRALPDGTFPEVGMTDRTVVGPLKTDRGLLRNAAAFSQGRPFRLEVFPADNVHRDPLRTLYR